MRDFFREHGIPDDMPIVQRYNTRAAEWYRRKLRAEAEGAEPPSPLPEGTGHLPFSEEPAPPQASIASSAAAAGVVSAGAAGAAYASSYHSGSPEQGGYHSGGGSSSKATGGEGPKMEGFGSDVSRSASGRPGGDEGFLGAIFNEDLTQKVSGGLDASLTRLGTWGNLARTFTVNRIEQAKTEGVLETVLDTTKRGASAAAETTQWAASKGVVVGKNTHTFFKDGGGKEVVGKTTEVIGTGARTVSNHLDRGVEWFGTQIGGPSQGGRVASDLQSRSTGRMQGFGSDSLAAEAPAPIRRIADPFAAFEAAGEGQEEGDRAPSVASVPASAEPAQPAAATKKVDVWGDDGWGDFN